MVFAAGGLLGAEAFLSGAAAGSGRAAAGPRQVGDEDPDIAGIVPGPEPPLWEDEGDEPE